MLRAVVIDYKSHSYWPLPLGSFLGLALHTFYSQSFPGSEYITDAVCFDLMIGRQEAVRFTNRLISFNADLFLFFVTSMNRLESCRRIDLLDGSFTSTSNSQRLHARESDPHHHNDLDGFEHGPSETFEANDEESHRGEWSDSWSSSI